LLDKNHKTLLQIIATVVVVVVVMVKQVAVLV
jgi:hypothetical protein